MKSPDFARIGAPLSGSRASISYQHNLHFAPLVPDNSNDNTMAYSLRVPTSAPSCPVLKSHDPKFTSQRIKLVTHFSRLWTFPFYAEEKVVMLHGFEF
ncbi:hypothetical protein BHE74_00044406 [Ensete ventricosum]|nr:hypothetical protein BHE74_00044406 [Ensete ventricosum]